MMYPMPALRNHGRVMGGISLKSWTTWLSLSVAVKAWLAAVIVIGVSVRRGVRALGVGARWLRQSLGWPVPS